MKKPDFSVVKNETTRSFLEYLWKRIEREMWADESNDNIRFIKLKRQLDIFMSGVNGKLPDTWNDLVKDFIEHNVNPSGSDGSFVKRIPVGA